MKAVFPDGQVVLLVEDEPLVADTLDAALTACGYRVLGPVATVNAAMRLLQTSQPDVALIDYRLATTTSEALLAPLVARHIPVCVLTGCDPAQLPSAYAHCTVLRKPFKLDALMAALGQVTI